MSDKKRAFFAAMLGSFLMSFGVLGSFLTAFSIRLPDGKSAFPVIAALCAAWSAVFPLIYSAEKRRRALLLAVLAAAAVCVLFRKQLTSSLLAVLDIVITSFSEAFDMPFSVAADHSASCVPFFALLSGLIAWLVSGTIIRKQSCFSAVFFSTLLMSVCLVLVFTPPSVACFLCVVGCDLLLLLTDRHRGIGSPDSDRLFLRLTVPLTALLLFAALLRNPMNDDMGTRFESLDERLSSFGEKLFGLSDGDANQTDSSGENEDDGEETGHGTIFGGSIPDTLGVYSWDNSLSEVDLGDVGRRRNNRTKVMEVTAEQSGVMYLRGTSYNAYDGTSWQNTKSDAAFSVATLCSQNYENQYTAEIITESVCSVLYTPYVPTVLPKKSYLFGDSYVDNLGELRSYTVYYNPDGTFLTDDDYTDYVERYYTGLPDDSLWVLEPIAQAATEGISGRRNRAQAICSYVSGSARYSLDVSKMPDSEEDFARWFLEECDEGYCVHFATACAALLRAADIPSRYVTGYMITATANTPVTVTAMDAHAWVEYYDTELGWTRLEATPGSGELPTGEGRPTEEQKPDQQKPEEKKPDPKQKDNSQGRENAGEEREPERTSFRLPGWSIALLSVAAVLTLWYFSVRLFKRRLFTAGNFNRQAVYVYRYLALICSVGRLTIPGEAEMLGQKARFSNHRLTEAERNAIYSRIPELEQAMLAGKPAPIRWMIGLLFGI